MVARAVRPRSAIEEGAGTGRMETSSMRSPSEPGPPFVMFSMPPVMRTNGAQPVGASGAPGPARSPPKVLLKTLKSLKPGWPMSSVWRSIGSTGSPRPGPGPSFSPTFHMTSEKSPFAVEKVPLPDCASTTVMEKFEKPEFAHSPL